MTEIFSGVEIATYLKATARIKELEGLVREIINNTEVFNIQLTEIYNRPQVQAIMEVKRENCSLIGTSVKNLHRKI